jgi:hypothetical protein
MKVIKEFGGMNAKELELRSTILYVSKEEPLEGKGFAKPCERD